MSTERVWIPLEQSRASSNEIVFADPLVGDDRQYRIASNPVFAAIGYDDVVDVRDLADVDAWIAGQEEPSDTEESLPFVTALRTRSPRVTLVFSILGNAKANVIDEISERLGQQCLDNGADGEGLGNATGIVCVPTDFSQFHGQAWQWLFDQLTALTPQLSRSAQSALEKDKAWLSVYFADVPEMSTVVVPGLRSRREERKYLQPDEVYEDLDLAVTTASELFSSGSDAEALRVIEHSAYLGNPLSLLHLMLRTIAAGLPGWALAADFWFEVGSYWDDCPSELNPYVWDDEVDDYRNYASTLQAAARLYASEPRHEADVLAVTGTIAYLLGQHHLAKGVLLRAANSGLTEAMAPALWIDSIIGDPSESLAVFERAHYPQVSSPDLPPLPRSPMFDDAFKELLSNARNSGAPERSNVLSNAGLAYALSGNPLRAQELWQEAEAFVEARWYSAVLLAHQGNMEGAVDRANALIHAEDWSSLEDGVIDIPDEFLESQLRPEYVAWMESAQELYSRLEY
jgi:hypothetical protein